MNILASILILVLIFPSVAKSQSASLEADTLRNRQSLLDGPGGFKDELRQRGISVDLWWSQYYQGLTHGDGDKDWQYGGKTDLIVNLDGQKLGLWPGLSINIHQEWLYGDDANSQGDGTFVPVNTALALPRLGGYEQDTSIVVNQQLGRGISVSLGKFNMLDPASRTPLLGGGGQDTFMNLALAAPISGVTPPYLVGVNTSVRTDRANYSLFIYDPRNAQDWDVVANPFEEGVTFSLSAGVPVTLKGLRGFQNFRAVYSTEEGIDLRDLPQLQLPPELQDEPRTAKEPWFLSYSFQQYLYQSQVDPSKGWGLFGQIGISDGNPNPFQGHYFIGIGGNSFIPGRLEDLWGIAYFNYRLSDDLRAAALADLGFKIEEEQGIEAYYNLALTPWFRLTGNIEVINPFPANKDTAVFMSVRSKVKF